MERVMESSAPSLRSRRQQKLSCLAEGRLVTQSRHCVLAEFSDNGTSIDLLQPVHYSAAVGRRALRDWSAWIAVSAMV